MKRTLALVFPLVFPLLLNGCHHCDIPASHRYHDPAIMYPTWHDPGYDPEIHHRRRHHRPPPPPPPPKYHPPAQPVPPPGIHRPLPPRTDRSGEHRREATAPPPQTRPSVSNRRHDPDTAHNMRTQTARTDTHAHRPPPRQAQKESNTTKSSERRSSKRDESKRDDSRHSDRHNRRR
ncbi:MAG: hypothetical protein LBK55_05725 [Azoarcus sp.]|jgi:hypothetical protein|nr:hypothetical protein [Azoarcus sp.]